jgi:hypothetical protein
MRERIYRLQGALEIESAPDAGTTVLVWVPLKERSLETPTRAVS